VLLFKLAGSNKTDVQPYSPASWTYVEIKIIYCSLCSRYRDLNTSVHSPFMFLSFCLSFLPL